MKDFKSRLQAYIDKEVERRVERRLHEILDSLGLEPAARRAAAGTRGAPRPKRAGATRKPKPVSEETRAKMREAWIRRKERMAAGETASKPRRTKAASTKTAAGE